LIKSIAFCILNVGGLRVTDPEDVNMRKERNEACSTYGRSRKSIQNFCQETWKKVTTRKT